MQEPTVPIQPDAPQLGALTDAVRSLVQKSPEAKRVAEALADWLRVICDTASNIPSSAASRGSPMTDTSAEAAMVDLGRLAAHNQSDDHSSLVDALAREEARRAVLERWKNPDVSPKVVVASRSHEAAPDPTQPKSTLDLTSVKRRIREHQRALDWAVSCARFGF